MAAEVNKPDFQYVWASGGTKVAPSDVKVQTGWTAEVPPYQWENWSQNRQDDAILHLFQKGISEWDTVSNYYFTTSGVRSYVQGSDGVVYVAVQDSVGQNPTTDATDTYWKVAFVDNSNLNTLTPGRLIKKTVITASGTFTPDIQSKLFHVRGVGGGGGAAGLNPTAAGTYNIVGGGAAGGYSEGWFTSVQIGSSIAVVVGLGGIAGTPGLNAGPGGATSLGALLNIPGGGGSIGVSTFPSATGSISPGGIPGAIPTGGSIVNMRGMPGGFGMNTTSSGQAIAGEGGSGPLGSGGESPAAPATYNPGTGYGSGAGGSASPASYGATPGIAGQPGVLIIEEYV